ncbi:PilN domain-containing protein [Pseudidiomarina donghaiensis]|uniref:Pilus assembly protein PilN n=1 Tax=Pseudidiomarina donghaiensis TaxID=519452 RepID=A0A432XHY5_9GAMM|nr:PilN domain-containing protein [Pseudidiomarina donghaiensis]RUO48369.1 pilus assembly protein PilN [Pseudidiomarina donghaiensis]SFV24286.1 type IV pilus assembly protein PilN [Pseudidiomarina donghaiensis]
MAHVNLLPWRETARQRAKTRFGIHAGIAVGIAAVIFGAAYMVIGDYKSYQQRRNNYLQSQIRILDSQIAEISSINKKKSEILNRIKLIQALHEDRNTAITIFNELTERTPDGVYLHALEKRDMQLIISGRSISNNRVSEFLRNLRESAVFEQPDLRSVVSADAQSRGRNARGSGDYDAFSLVVNIVPPASAEAAKK